MKHRRLRMLSKHRARAADCQRKGSENLQLVQPRSMTFSSWLPDATTTTKREHTVERGKKRSIQEVWTPKPDTVSWLRKRSNRSENDLCEAIQNQPNDTQLPYKR